MTRGAVDAERGERLQVGLDAGAAAGIRAGDGDGDGGHRAPRSPAPASTIARSAPRRGRGSLGSEDAEITATPSAPAAITARRIARRRCRRWRTTGNPACARRSASTMRAGRRAPIGGSGCPSRSSHRRRRCRHSRSASSGAARRPAPTVLIDSPMIASRPEQPPRVLRRACRPGRHARRRLPPASATSTRSLISERHAVPASAALMRAGALDHARACRRACRAAAPASRRRRRRSRASSASDRARRRLGIDDGVEAQIDAHHVTLRPCRSACARRAHTARRGSPARSCPARARALARDLARDAEAPAAPRRSPASASLSTARNAATSAEAAQPMAVTRAISGWPFAIATKRAPSVTQIRRAGERHHGAACRAHSASARSSSAALAGKRGELRAIEPHRARRSGATSALAKAARGGERSTKTGSSTHGLPSSPRRRRQSHGRGAPLASRTCRD